MYISSWVFSTQIHTYKHLRIGVFFLFFLFNLQRKEIYLAYSSRNWEVKRQGAGSCLTSGEGLLERSFYGGRWKARRAGMWERSNPSKISLTHS
jgi:hypothetical protein